MEITNRYVKRGFGLVATIAVLTATTPAVADIQKAVNQALNQNPDIRQLWREVLISDADIDIARSGAKPSLDLVSGYEFTDRNYSTNRTFNAGFAEIQLSQLLYDGVTQQNIARVEEIQIVRYHELIATANNVVLNTVRAYLDVKRQQELVRLAVDNFRQHQIVFSQVEESFNAGVARSSDLEQISGRKALAQANLITEQSNLHDVIAQYLRVTGSLPPAQLDQVTLENSLLSADIYTQIESAYQQNPRVLASLHNIEAERINIRANERRNRPTVQLTASYGMRENTETSMFATSQVDTQREARVGVQVRYNLFRGGSDRANIRRAHEMFYLAEDIRTSVCMDVQQDIHVSHNELKSLDQRIPSLRQHMNASDRVRVAYSDQFRIGSRTLLDVLDSENEFFQASIAHTNAQYEKVITQAQLLNNIGVLAYVVGGATDQFPQPRLATHLNVDFSHVCPTYDLSGYVSYE